MNVQAALNASIGIARPAWTFQLPSGGNEPLDMASALFKFAVLAEMRDTETSNHMVRVGQLAGLLAQQMTGDAHFAAMMCRAAPLHDIGKVCVRDAVLMKPGPLTDREWVDMRLHTVMGADLLRFPGHPLAELAEEIALHHHERHDGAGYPAGLIGADIPMSARIVSVVDFLDAATMRRCYKPAMPAAQVLLTMAAQAGRQFDPEIVECALAIQTSLLDMISTVNERLQGRRLSDFGPTIFSMLPT